MKSALSRSRLKPRLIAFGGALVVLSLFASGLSLFRIREMNQNLAQVTHLAIPLSRAISQMKSDSESLKREVDRALGFRHWKDPAFVAHSIPIWMRELILNSHQKLTEVTAPYPKWKLWNEKQVETAKNLFQSADDLATALKNKDQDGVARHFESLNRNEDFFLKGIDWAAHESENLMRRSFSQTESRVEDLQEGLQAILLVVIVLSLVFLWFVDRTLTPLAALTRVVKQISARGIQKEDKKILPFLPLGRADEVSELSHEFHRMATVLLEREKTVEEQKEQLTRQNRLLTEMSSLTKNILDSIRSSLIVVDENGIIRHCNPEAIRTLGLHSLAQLVGSPIDAFPFMSQFFKENEATDSSARSLRKRVGEKVYGPSFFDLKNEKEEACGVIFLLEDLTRETEFETRLREAEQLATVGRMSAQVAHEVRNPLHSIGLEAELAYELAQKIKHSELKLATASILKGVERLEKMTENYLKFSKVSFGEKKVFDLAEVVEKTLALYSNLFVAAATTVNWSLKTSEKPQVLGDPDLVEQCIGNLIKNSIQALKNSDAADKRIELSLSPSTSRTQWVIEVKDNGPGLTSEAKEKLYTAFFTTKAEGTGLGLSFVKRVMEEHHGRVEYRESQDSPHATSFHLVLPMLLETRKEIPFEERAI